MHRLEQEYNVECRLERLPHSRAKWLNRLTPDLAAQLPFLVTDEADRPVALFRSDFEIDFAKERHDDLELLDKPPTEEEQS